MYHFALPAFMGLFKAALALETPAASVPVRIVALKRRLVELVFAHAARWGVRQGAAAWRILGTLLAGTHAVG
jgi:hypothetical protein